MKLYPSDDSVDVLTEPCIDSRGICRLNSDRLQGRSPVGNAGVHVQGYLYPFSERHDKILRKKKAALWTTQGRSCFSASPSGMERGNLVFIGSIETQWILPPRPGQARWISRVRGWGFLGKWTGLVLHVCLP